MWLSLNDNAYHTAGSLVVTQKCRDIRILECVCDQPYAEYWGLTWTGMLACNSAWLDAVPG